MTAIRFKFILAVNAAVLVVLIAFQVVHGPLVVIKQPRCPSIEIMERPGPQPDLFNRNPPQGVDI